MSAEIKEVSFYRKDGTLVEALVTIPEGTGMYPVLIGDTDAGLIYENHNGLWRAVSRYIPVGVKDQYQPSMQAIVETLDRWLQIGRDL